MSNTTATLFASRSAADPYLKRLGEQGMRAENVLVVQQADLAQYGRGENLASQQAAGFYQTLADLGETEAGQQLSDILMFWGLDHSNAVHLQRAVESGQTLVVVRSNGD